MNTTAPRLGTYADDAPATIAHDGETYTRADMLTAECPDCGGVRFATAEGVFTCRTEGCDSEGIAPRDVLIEWDEIATTADNGALIVFRYDYTEEG